MSKPKGRYVYEYERPSLTVDVVIVTRGAALSAMFARSPPCTRDLAYSSAFR